MAPVRAEPAQLQTFRTEARIEIDAQGHVVSVQPDPGLHTVLADAVRQQIAGWRFEAPRRDGVPVSGVTFVQTAVCLAPADDGNYRLAVDYTGNGPRRSGPLVPAYPVELIKRQLGGSMKLTFRVGPDGRAVIESLEPLSVDPGAAPAIKAAVRDWFSRLRFEPEQLDGQPIATRMSFPVDFMPGGSTATAALARKKAADIQAQDLERQASGPNCQAALQAASGTSMVAIDSPFRRLAAP